MSEGKDPWKDAGLPGDAYAFAAKLALDRMNGPGKDEHMALIGMDTAEGVSEWSQAAHAIHAIVVDGFAEKKLLEGEPINEQNREMISFAAGFFFGRAFEETQIVQLNHSGEISIKGRG